MWRHPYSCPVLPLSPRSLMCEKSRCIKIIACILEYIRIKWVFLCNSWRSISRYGGEQKLPLNLGGEQEDKHLVFIVSKKCEWDLRGFWYCLELFYILLSTRICPQGEMGHFRRKLSKLCIWKTNYASVMGVTGGIQKREMLPHGWSAEALKHE